MKTLLPIQLFFFFGIGLTIFMSCNDTISKQTDIEVPKLKWHLQKSHSSASIRGLCAVNENVAWLSGANGTIRKTTDGGQNWIKLQVPETDSLDFRDIQAFDDQTAIIMSAGPGDNSRIYKTQDGGQNWQLIHTNTIEAGFFNGIAFWDEKNGLLAGDPVDSALFLLKTTDGGETWKRIPPNNIPPIKEGEYGFAASGTHIAVFGENQAWIGTGGQTSSVFFSEDAGENWQVVTVPMISGAPSTGIFSLTFSSAQNGIAVGGDYTKEKEGKDNIIITNDGGKSWSLAVNPLNYRSCVQIIEDWIIAVGPSGSELSLDKGQTWQTIDTIGFHTLSIGNKKTGIWAAGADGRIAKLMNNE